MEYSNLKKLGKDELIYLITMLEKDIRSDYEKYTVPENSKEFYNKIRELFSKEKDDSLLNPIPNSYQTNMFIRINPHILYLNTVTLKTEYGKQEMILAFDETNLYPIFANQKLDTVLAKNINQVIAINKTSIDSIEDSSLYYESSIRDLLVLRMTPNKKEITLRDLSEIVFRLRRDIIVNEDKERFSHFKSHIDENGTLFLQVKFDYFSAQDDDTIETEEDFNEEE